MMVRIWHIDAFFDCTLSVNEDIGGNAFIEMGPDLGKIF